jgi:hypothetical protein
MFNHKLKRLTLLPSRLRESGYDDLPEYRKIRDFATNGGLPTQQLNGRWYFLESDVPAIAEALGLDRTDTTTQRAA